MNDQEKSLNKYLLDNNMKSYDNFSRDEFSKAMCHAQEYEETRREIEETIRSEREEMTRRVNVEMYENNVIPSIIDI